MQPLKSGTPVNYTTHLDGWTFTQSFKPEDAEQVAELDEFMSLSAHRNEDQGFWFPSPPKGEMVRVFCTRYEKDDSDPQVRKRTITVRTVPLPN